MMAGAKVTMLVSALLQNGIGYLRPLRHQLESWMEKHEYESVRQMQGMHVPEERAQPQGLQRANYMNVLSSYSMK